MAGPYRDDTAALSDRLSHVRDELEAVRERARELERLQTVEKDLTREADALTKKLDARRALPLLESIRIASPCNAKWEDMKGDERVRFCGHCDKNVYNIAGMSRDEAERLVTSGSSVCVRLYRRTDGTVLTQDCPDGVRRKRRRGVLAAVAVGGGLAASAVGVGFTRMGSIEPPPMGGPRVGVEMGDIAPVMGAAVAVTGTPVVAPPETGTIVEAPPPRDDVRTRFATPPPPKVKAPAAATGKRPTSR